jgi:hypothetical protein
MPPGKTASENRELLQKAAKEFPNSDIKQVIAKCPPKEVLTEKEAEDLFRELSNNTQIPFDYPVDCCPARAHEMCRIMESRGIKSQKLFYFSKDYPNAADLGPKDQAGKSITFPNPRTGDREPFTWRYHVAPMVKMQKQGEPPGEYILDPSITKGPVTKEKWKEIMGNPAGAYEQPASSKVYFKNKKFGQYMEDPKGEVTAERFKDHSDERKEAFAAEKEKLKKQEELRKGEKNKKEEEAKKEEKPKEEEKPKREEKVEKKERPEKEEKAKKQ